ncbi:MAG: hypothetical protein KF794_11440 [Xanthobacteraceae bacterium]|nr:MAG: hypothetical protein KF794_11440 [Xanthobacteraceae bacterium]
MQRFAFADEQAGARLGADSATFTFQNTGTGFTVRGVPMARETLFAEGGFDIRLTPLHTVGLLYAANASTTSLEQQVKGKFELKF